MGIQYLLTAYIDLTSGFNHALSLSLCVCVSVCMCLSLSVPYNQNKIMSTSYERQV